MSGRRSLRRRVAVTLAVFGGGVSLLLATVIYLASHDLERRLIDETLTSELDDYVQRRQRNPQSLPETTATIRAFVVAGQGAPQVPAVVAALTPGSHWLELEDIPYRGAVRAVAGQRFVVLYDVSALYQRERGFLLLLSVSVLLVTTFSAVSGHLLAARMIAPVTELAHRVTGLRPEDEPAPLAGEFPWVEVQRLAADFDDYLQRLHAFIERERLFTGDVSHELRTPLAVIQGATELLLTDASLDHKARNRVARIDRAVTEMTELTGALLALAREQEGAATQTGHAPCDVEQLVEELLARHRQLFRGKPVAFSLEVVDRPQVRADRAVLSMVLGNLLRNAVGFTNAGEVRVRLEADAVEVQDTGSGIGDANVSTLFQPYVRGAASDGAGLGLSLVQRLCVRQGWEVSLANRPEGGTVARLSFGHMEQPKPGIA